AAGHALGRRIIVVAHPNGADEIAGVADEPGIAPIVSGASLAAGRHPIQLRAASGAVLDDGVHHLDHVDSHFRTHYLLRLWAIAVETPHQLTAIGAHLEGRMRHD